MLVGRLPSWEKMNENIKQIMRVKCMTEIMKLTINEINPISRGTEKNNTNILKVDQN